MDCGKCGAHNPRGNQFCVKCGARLAPARVEQADARPAPDPIRAQRLLEQAFQFSDQGLLDEAIEACSAATIANPSSTSAHSFLGILYERAGEREKAIREYELALSLSPESVAERESLQQLATETGPPIGLPKIAPRLVRNVAIGAFAAAIIILMVGVFVVYNRGRVQTANVAMHYPYPEGGSSAPTGEVQQGLPEPSASGSPAAAAPAPAPAPSAYPVFRSFTPLPGSPFGFPAPGKPPQFQQEPKPARIALPRTGRVLEWQPPVAFSGPPVRAPVQPPANVRAAPEPVMAAPQVARSLYFGRQYDEAIQVYERMLRLRPGGEPEIREELAWCYYQVDRGRDALSQYQQALGAYQTQLDQGVEPEQARLGMRTCRAAVEALSARASR